MLKSAEVDTKAQASTQRHEHHNFCLSINKGDWTLHPPFDRETTTTSNNMEVESHRSNNRLLSGLHRGEDAGENAMEDPVMNFDFGVDVFLSDLFNPEILEGSDQSSLASLADLLNSETMVGSKPSSPPMADLLISEVMVYSNPSLLPSSDSPTCDLDGKNQSCK
ncbi:hypothetical protein SAY87_026037 [Trapa incisa]|uniref:Uncharacterized protein n=1 Tax=Trapa incisa TaxID=236973 RepID=A0AAN7GT91_9MYRT|nr:hypothetical protein SAY87_026037 [Trapa incisa]